MRVDKINEPAGKGSAYGCSIAIVYGRDYSLYDSAHMQRYPICCLGRS
jgi:hypothetical protein